MSPEPAPTTSDPQQLLAVTRQLTRHVRREQRGGWFPLLVLAVATFVAIPFDRYGGHRLVSHCTSLGPGRRVCTAYSPGAIWYWPVALVMAYTAISIFYFRRSLKRGVGTRVWPYVIAGVVLVALATAWSLWAVANPSFLAQHLHLGSSPPAGVLNRLASPAGAIGLALIVLAWIERSALLLAITSGYLILVVTAAGRRTRHSLRPILPHVSPWAFLLHVLILGSVLLVGSIVLALTHHARDRSTA